MQILHGYRTAQHLSLLAVCLVTLLCFLSSAKAALSLLITDERYSYFGFAPLLCMVMIYLKQDEVFVNSSYSPRLGVPLLASSILLGLFMGRWSPQLATDNALFVAFALVLSWIAGFILCYGVQSFRSAIYPLSCLFLTLPIPSTWMDHIVAFLQQGSANVSYAILEAFGVSVFRHGMDFAVPGLNFQIAPECSGIHSGLCFLIAGILSAYLFLRTGWLRLLLIFSTIPIAIFKNAVRIVVIALLGAYVDPVFINGPFHHKYSGIVFAPLDFVFFVPFIFALRRLDRYALRHPLPAWVEWWLGRRVNSAGPSNQ